MRSIILILLSISLSFIGEGCISELVEAEMPLLIPVPPGNAIDSVGQSRLQGIYYVAEGTAVFGDTLVALSVRDHLCFYAGSQVILCECSGAISGDTARFDGYYRYVRSAETGNMSLSILPTEGGLFLRNQSLIGTITIRGAYYNQNTRTTENVRLIRSRSISPSTHGFQIIGNCAGGRNSERLGRSENSAAMARFSEYLGCTGIEIDLHVTSDGEVILMHDDSFSPRTIESTYILGDIANFTLKQIRNNARLIHGEEIPTLEEFLTFVVDSTRLEFVWLDPKVSVGIEQTLQVQKNALDRASQKGRKLQILFGIPTQEILDAYRKAPTANKTPVLCELAPDILRSLPSAKAWGPRWTIGLQTATVEQLHKEGYEVYPWTIDSPEYMAQFLEQRQSPYDGILSNYPSMLTGLYHLRLEK